MKTDIRITPETVTIFKSAKQYADWAKEELVNNPDNTTLIGNLENFYQRIATKSQSELSKAGQVITGKDLESRTVKILNKIYPYFETRKNEVQSLTSELDELNAELGNSNIGNLKPLINNAKAEASNLGKADDLNKYLRQVPLAVSAIKSLIDVLSNIDVKLAAASSVLGKLGKLCSEAEKLLKEFYDETLKAGEGVAKAIRLINLLEIESPFIETLSALAEQQKASEADGDMPTVDVNLLPNAADTNTQNQK